MKEFFSPIAALIDGSLLQAGALWALREIPGFPPIIQTVHLLGIAVIMGSIVMLNLRTLGLAMPSQSLAEMSARLSPWLWWALASNFVSGSFFLLARPLRYFENPVFFWKLGFLIPAIILSVVSIRATAGLRIDWEISAPQKNATKLIAFACLALWILTAMAGRWIAYAEYIFFPA